MRREMGIIQCHLIKMELKGMKKNGMFDVHMKLDICYIFLSKFSRDIFSNTRDLAIHAKNQIISFEALYTWILLEKPLRE
jgi:hypothetical protein